MAKFTGITLSVYKGNCMLLHKAGCRDIEKAVRQGGGYAHEIDAPTVKDALDILVDEELREMGYGHEHVTVLPCCRTATSRGSQMDETTTTETIETANATMPETPAKKEPTMTKTKTPKPAKVIPPNAIPKLTFLKREEAEAIAASLNEITMTPLKKRFEAETGAKATSSNRAYLMRKIIVAVDAGYGSGKYTRLKVKDEAKAGKAKAEKKPRAAKAKVAKERDSRLPKVGAFVERVFDGKTYKVEVLEDGFKYAGKTYRSLSAVAKEISGTTWNGFLFFHLQAYPEHKKAA